MISASKTKSNNVNNRYIHEIDELENNNNKNNIISFSFQNEDNKHNNEQYSIINLKHQNNYNNNYNKNISKQNDVQLKKEISRISLVSNQDENKNNASPQGLATSIKLVYGILPQYQGNYKGYLKHQKKDGFGITEYPNDPTLICIYKGNNYENMAEGYGIYIQQNKETKSINYSYHGQFVKNHAYGFGIYKSDGTYIGEWIKNVPSGIGIEEWVNGSQYKGEFKEGAKKGIGTYIWNDGCIYQGEWKNNYMDGYGIYTFKDGRIYSGQWNLSTMNGYGELVSKDGKYYFGNFTKNKRNGFGILIWRSKLKAYIGFWENNMQHGFGKYVSNKKDKYGLWCNGTQTNIFNSQEEFEIALRNQNSLKSNNIYNESYNALLYKKYFEYSYKTLDMFLLFSQMK